MINVDSTIHIAVHGVRYSCGMSDRSEWISAREAAEHLGVKLTTLYAYASRGLLESVPAADGRGRRYPRSAVERLKARHDARAGHAAVAASALRWGEPSLETSVSEIRADGPYYRGESAMALAATATSFESVAELLWRGALGEARWAAAPLRVRAPARPKIVGPIAYLAAALALAALQDDTRHGATDGGEHARARRIVLYLASLAGGVRAPSSAALGVAQRLLLSFGARSTPRAVYAVDRALILCADHELNASTFAARVTASTGADLYACLGAGLHALSGTKHGGVTARVEALVREIDRPNRAAEVVRARLARGEEIPGFGHTLYGEGDPRAAALLALARDHKGRRGALRCIDGLAEAMVRAGQPAPNLDFGLVALCAALSLPAGAPQALFAVGRLAGWVAHALEQRAQGYLLRPRSRYVPQPPHKLAR